MNVHGEALKVVLYPQGKVTLNGKQRNKYIMAAVVVTDEEIPEDDQNVFVGVLNSLFGSTLTSVIKTLKRYKTPYPLGTLSQALIDVSNMGEDDLEEIE